MQKSNKVFDSFRDILFELSDGERQIEIIRQLLCEQRHFEPYAAFRRLDRTRKNSLDCQDISNFLAYNDMDVPANICSLFIKRYDKDEDNKLNYTE